MRLGKNFTLEEFLVSETAERNGIDMTPPAAVVDNLTDLVETCLQPLRDHLGLPIHITSGYRPRVLNTLIGGSTTSAHVDGRAADFRVDGMEPLAVCRAANELDIPFDQVIHEFGRWVHLGIAREPRRELLTAYHDGRTRYRFGLLTIEEAKA